MLFEMAQQHAYGSLGLDPDPQLGFVGVRARRELAYFWQAYQIRRPAGTAGPGSPPGPDSARRRGTEVREDDRREQVRAMGL
jgi:hypothetical protein